MIVFFELYVGTIIVESLLLCIDYIKSMIYTTRTYLRLYHKHTKGLRIIDKFMKNLVKYLKNNKLIFLIILVFSLIPFFWFQAGEMDLGGDSNRLYFYDPFNYLKNCSLYLTLPFDIATIDPLFYMLPFLILHMILKYIFASGYMLILVFNIVKLCGGFLGMYFIIKELLKTNESSYQGGEVYSKKIARLAGILAGLFYIFSSSVTVNWNTALFTHNQVFLNPLMFYVLLKYLLTHNNKFLWIALLISFIFAPNFSPGSAPPFFSFYPLSFAFISLYVIFIRKQKLPWKGIFIGIILFLTLHSFWILPTVSDFSSPNSINNTRVFTNQTEEERTQYFFGTLMFGKPGLNILSYPQAKTVDMLAILFPLIIILGLLQNRKKQKLILLAAIFFLLTFYLATANIGFLAVYLYSKFYFIPGFEMFRNFSGQWSFVFYFFYALLFGLAIFILFSQLQRRLYVQILFLLLAGAIFLSSTNFINGTIVKKFGINSGNLRIGIKMDPRYEETLSFIRSLKVDGKFLTLPLTNSYFQIVRGTTEGTYIGPSMLSYLAGKNDFAGYTTMAPFSETFLMLSKAKNYKAIKHLLGLLNIHYIYYNTDPGINRETFPNYLYTYIDKFLPPDKKTYQELVKNIVGKKIFERGTYQIYSVDEKTYLPHFYVPAQIDIYHQDNSLEIYKKALSFFPGEESTNEARMLYVDRSICRNIFSKEQCNQKIDINKKNLPKIQFQKINPTKYKISITEAKEPFFLVFLSSYNQGWKVFVSPRTLQKKNVFKTYFDGMIAENVHEDVFFNQYTFETVNMPSIPDERHIEVNGYANAWYIKPEDVDKRKEYELVVEMVGQRVFYIGLAMTTIVFIGFIVWGGFLFLKRPNNQ